MTITLQIKDLRWIRWTKQIHTRAFHNFHILDVMNNNNKNNFHFLSIFDYEYIKNLNQMKHDIEIRFYYQ